MLLDESVSLGDVSTSSFGTPLPAKGATELDYSPITPFAAKREESEDEQDIFPSSPLDGKIAAESIEADEDVPPPSIPERDHTPTPKADPEPQTPLRRPKIQITMETEAIVVRTHRLMSQYVR